MESSAKTYPDVEFDVVVRHLAEGEFRTDRTGVGEPGPIPDLPAAGD